jgi:uncharacterized protein YgbK (DUF1537 family)
MRPPLFSYYGDDFTGSTDALEALAGNGLDTVLFLRTPDDDDLRQFSGCRAVGIAGNSRSQPPKWMRFVLPAVFGRLREIGAPVVQYKVCSTFDSSPGTGSIGCALEIGREAFHVPCVPVVPAAPLLERYVVFGNMFAQDGSGIHRIDRHASMMNHPVTPMTEGDLLVHLSRQTNSRLALVNLLDLRSGAPFPADAGAVLFDGIDPSDLALAARTVWEHRGDQQTFVVGSSGFTYGMLDYWRALGRLEEPVPRAPATPTDRLLVLAGSCSPATGRQICCALRDGFHGIRLSPRQLDQPAAKGEALACLAEGRSVVLYSAVGPADRVDIPDRHALSAAMGRLLRDIIFESGVTRVVVAGGDTASHAVGELGIHALTFAAPLARGAPLCRAHGWPGELELVLKGGQVGSEDFFEKVLSWA